jgi:hypothetical protein
LSTGISVRTNVGDIRDVVALVNGQVTRIVRTWVPIITLCVIRCNAIAKRLVIHASSVLAGILATSDSIVAVLFSTRAESLVEKKIDLANIIKGTRIIIITNIASQVVVEAAESTVDAKVSCALVAIITVVHHTRAFSSGALGVERAGVIIVAVIAVVIKNTTDSGVAGVICTEVIVIACEARSTHAYTRVASVVCGAGISIVTGRDVIRVHTPFVFLTVEQVGVTGVVRTNIVVITHGWSSSVTC